MSRAFVANKDDLTAAVLQTSVIKMLQVDDDGVPLGTCLLLFNKWLNRMREKHKFVINDIREGWKTATFVTWYGAE